MRIPGLKLVRSVSQWIQGRIQPHALILGYHRVTDESDDPFGICVTSSHFKEQLEVLQRYANVIRLQELIEGIKRGQLPECAVTITFDDGYSDLLYIAKPILEDFQLPYTVFIPTGCIGQEFWWDELNRLLQANNPTTHHFTRHLYQELLSLPPGERQRAMEKLRDPAISNVTENGRPRALKFDELVELSKGNLIEVGSHGVNHLSLNQISADAQRSEIQDSKTFLENQLGRFVNSFSYPNGSFSISSRKLISTSGYDSACGSKPGLVFQSSDLYHLPRFWVPDWDGKTFKRWLLRWL